MTRYLISFDVGWMTFPDEELPAVSDAAHAVVREAKLAGVWVFGGGLTDPSELRLVRPDGSVTNGPDSKAYVSGFCILDVGGREEALEWAGKVATACRCAQEVREIMFDPEV